MNAGLFGFPDSESLAPFPAQDDYGPYLNAVTAAGGSMTTLSAQVANRFLYELGQRRYNRSILLIAPFLGSDLLAAKILLRNRIDGSLVLTTTALTNSDYVEANGVTGNGAGYFTTSFKPFQVGFAGGLFAAVGGTVAATGDIFCETDLTGTDKRWVLSLRTTSFFFTWGSQGSASVTTSPTPPTAGRFYGQRKLGSLTLRELYKNGAQVATSTGSDATVPTTLSNFTIMCNNSEVNAKSNFCTSAHILKLAMITDGSLTAAEIADLDAVVLAYFLTPLGR